MIWLVKYWKYLAGLLGVILIGSGFYLYRGNIYRQGHNDATAKISAELAKTAEKQSNEAYKVDYTFQEAKTKSEERQRVRYVQVPKVITRVEYRNECIDDDGLRLINEAVADRR